MAFKFFRVSLHDLDGATNELNQFLTSHRVDSIERQFVNQGENSYWLFCIEYHEPQQARTLAASAGTRRRERIDYRDVLNDDDFQTYLRLKELRQQIAQEESLAVYLIFTNEHLAKIAEAHVRTKEDLQKIDGIGKARVEKYGDRVLKWLHDSRGNEHEASGESVPADSAAGEPSTGGNQGPAGKTSAS